MPDLTKISIVLSASDATYDDDEKLVEDWLIRNKDAITQNSGNTGCQCCVDIWDIECSATAAKEIPDRLLASSEWSRG